MKNIKNNKKIMYELIIYTKNNKQIIKLEYASDFIKRLKGLMGKEKIKPLLFIQPYTNRYLSTIHTFFMKKTIDIIYISQENMINETKTLKPWRIYIPKKNKIKYIIELPQNTLKQNNIENNTRIKIVKKDEK